MFIPEYQEIIQDISIWNSRVDNPSLLCHLAGDFVAFANNESVFLGPVQLTLFEYGIGDEKSEKGHKGLLAVKIIIRSTNNPAAIYLSCGLERLKCVKSSMVNVLNLKVDSGTDYSLSCKDHEHCNSLFDFLEFFIQKSQILKEKYSQIVAKHANRSSLLETWKIKAKEIEKEELLAQEASSTENVNIISKQDSDMELVKQDPDSVKQEPAEIAHHVEVNAEATQINPECITPQETKNILEKSTLEQPDDTDQSLVKGISDVTLEDEPQSIETRRQKLVSSMEKKNANPPKNQIKLEQYQQKLFDNTALLISAREETGKLKDDFVNLVLENSQLKKEIYNKSDLFY
jgi:hypothetical protein